MIIGASFSHRHLNNLSLSVNDALKHFSALGLKNIRLSCYWSEIEKTQGQYDFSIIDNIVDICQKLKLQIVLTVGMKAMRYPEYYIPNWALDKIQIKHSTFTYTNNLFNNLLFAFIENTLWHFKNINSIKYWQIENEPFDPSGPSWWKSDYSILEKEISLVKNIDSSRPVIINLWGNELQNRKYYPQAKKLADIIGIDLYPKVSGKDKKGNLFFQGPKDPDDKIQEIINDIKKQNKKVWISELQAEPWVYPNSCQPQDIIINSQRVSNWNIDGIFYWGFEYWYQQKLLGNLNYWQAIQQTIELLKSNNPTVK